jgi:hypothetical protein
MVVSPAAYRTASIAARREPGVAAASVAPSSMVTSSPRQCPRWSIRDDKTASSRVGGLPARAAGRAPPGRRRDHAPRRSPHLLRLLHAGRLQHPPARCHRRRVVGSASSPSPSAPSTSRKRRARGVGLSAAPLTARPAVASEPPRPRIRRERSVRRLQRRLGRRHDADGSSTREASPKSRGEAPSSRRRCHAP